MIVLSYSSAYGVSLQNARRLTEEEKKHCLPWFAESGFVSLGDEIELTKLNFDDIADLWNAPSDGSFRGCNNTAWILSKAEADAYKKLNAERIAAENQRKIEEQEKAEAEIKARKQELKEWLSVFDSWTASDVKKENGLDGADFSVKYTFVLKGKEYRFTEQLVFDFGRVINPVHFKAMATNLKNDGWMWQTELGSIPLTDDEIACVRVISKYGRLSANPVKM